MVSTYLRRAVCIGALTGSLLYAVAVDAAQRATVGVNVAGPLRQSVDKQNAALDLLRDSGVKVIRLGVSPDDAGVDYLRRAYQRGLQVLLLIDFRYAPDAPTRPYRPKEYPELWGGHPLSSADVGLSRAYFQDFLTRIDRAGVKLAGMELGNEINGSAFNADFDVPGEHKAFGLADLEKGEDRQARQIATGFRRYVDVIAALKDVRDKLSVNHDSPIVSAGLVGYAEDFSSAPQGGGDVVYLSAALQYLRDHGLSKVVDAYGIHSYPSSSSPSDPAAGARRLAHFEKYDLQQCRPANSADGKPCWITEWGFENPDKSCPSNEAGRLSLIRQMAPGFRQAVAEQRLTGLFYYTWTGDPWLQQADPYSVVRCGAPTAAGSLAADPLSGR